MALFFDFEGNLFSNGAKKKGKRFNNFEIIIVIIL